jgi:hypothetical protein
MLVGAECVRSVTVLVTGRDNRVGVDFGPTYMPFGGAVGATTVPPFALQSFSESSIQPLPLQEFWPLHPFAALWHDPCPLQELTPWQWTFAVSPADEVAGVDAANSPAAIAAMIAPLVVIFDLLAGRSFKCSEKELLLAATSRSMVVDAVRARSVTISVTPLDAP